MLQSSEFNVFLTRRNYIKTDTIKLFIEYINKYKVVAVKSLTSPDWLLCMCVCVVSCRVEKRLAFVSHREHVTRDTQMTWTNGWSLMVSTSVSFYDHDPPSTRSQISNAPVRYTGRANITIARVSWMWQSFNQIRASNANLLFGLQNICKKS